RPCPQRGSFREGHVAYCLHNLAEDPLGIGAAKKGSRIDQHLREALAETEVRHRGLPALRAILRVRLTVTKEGEEPARFLITEVIDTEWDETGLSSR
ncbi:MAG: hypothetical protein Q7Q71_10205, partial [Verrucomicrobiota bacterium JB023]|nr:hypothetical protein [Verrucomicrobiota bacterium JB023]